MRNKKAQGLPLRQIIIAAIVLLTLIVVVLIGPSAIRTGFNNILKVLGLMGDDEMAGDYIIQAYVELIDGHTAVLHFTPNPIRCAEIRDTHPYTISQGLTAHPEKYIPKEEFEEVVRWERKGDCSETLDTDPFTLIRPNEFGTRIVNIEVYGEEGGEFPIETVPIEINEWERLLTVYLNTEMWPMGEGNLNGPYYSPILWSRLMHIDPGPAFWDDFPHDQSLDLSTPEIEAAVAFMDDVPDLYRGTFKDFLTNFACTNPEWNTGASGVKDNAFQVIVTALFGDIQDFENTFGNPPTAGQPVPRIRDGIGPRGWDSTQDKDYKNQLFPVEIGLWYPGMAVGGNLAWNPEAMVRSRTKHWIRDDTAFYGRARDAEIIFDGPAGSCLEGKQITAYIKVCPENICESSSEEEGPPEPEPEEQELVCTPPAICAEEIPDCTIYLEVYDYPGCCPQVDPFFPPVKPADSYYVHQGFCYHCTADKIWESSSVDDSLCMP